MLTAPELLLCYWERSHISRLFFSCLPSAHCSALLLSAPGGATASSHPSTQQGTASLQPPQYPVGHCILTATPAEHCILTATPAPSGVDPHGLQKELPESPESQIPTAAANKRLLHTTKEIGLGARCTVPISLLPGHCSVVRAAPADTVCTANLTNRSVSPMQTPSP